MEPRAVNGGQEYHQYVGTSRRTSSQEWSNANAVSQVLLPDALQPIKTFMVIATIVLGWFSVSLEMLIRHRFGERYLSTTRLFLAFLAMTFIAGSGQLVALFNSTSFRGVIGFLFFQLVYWAFIILAVVHRIRIWQRNRQGVQWHSMSFGISWLSKLIGVQLGPVRITDWTLYCWIEPALFLLLGILAWGISGTVGVWFFIGSASLFIKNQLVYNEQRGKILDVMDAQLEAQYLQNAFQGEFKTQTAGISIIPLPTPLGRPLASDPPNFTALMQSILGAQTAQAPVVMVPAAQPSAPPLSPSASVEQAGAPLEQPPATEPLAAPLSNPAEPVAASDAEPLVAPPSNPAEPVAASDAEPLASSHTKPDLPPTETSTVPHATLLAALPVGGSLMDTALAQRSTWWIILSGIAMLIVIGVVFVRFTRANPQEAPAKSVQPLAPNVGIASSITTTPTVGSSGNPAVAISEATAPPRSSPSTTPTTVTTPTLPPPTPTLTPLPLVATQIPKEQMDVKASGSAPSSVNGCNERTTFGPEHVLDGRLDTAWRVPGDGIGSFVELSFDTPTQVTSLQLAPGYTKTDPCDGVNRFWQNRRVRAVDLLFSDGTTAIGRFEDRPELQLIEFAPVTTDWVRVTVRETTDVPATNGRDFTPISEIVVSGATP